MFRDTDTEFESFGPMAVRALLLALAVTLSACGGSEEELPGSGDPPGGDQPPKPAESRDDLLVTFSLGARSNWTYGRVAEALVTIDNRRENLEGTLTLRGRTIDGKNFPDTYRRNIIVPKNSSRVFAIPVDADDWDHAHIEFRGNIRFSKTVEIAAPPTGPDGGRVDSLLICGSESVPNLGLLTSDLAKRNAPTVVHEGDGPNSVREIQLPVDELPMTPAGYQSYRLLVLFDTTLARISEARWEALQTWVQQGGTLIAFPGSSWTSGIPNRIQQLLGVRSIDPDAEPSPTLLAKLDRSSVTGRYYELEPASGTRQSRDGLLVMNRPGLGLTYTFAWTPAARAIPFREECPFLYRVFDEAYDRAGSFAATSESRLKQVEPSITGILDDNIGYSFPSRGSIFLALLAYLGIGFTLPVIFFKRRGRRELTFVVIPIVAFAATFGVYRYGLLSSLPHSRIDEFSITRLSMSGEGARTSSYVVLTSPRLTQLGLDEEFDGWSERHLSVSRVHSFNHTSTRIAPLHFEADRAGSVRVPELELLPNAPARLRIEYDDTSPSLVVRDVSGNGTRKISVENKSDQGIRFAYRAKGAWSSGPVLQPSKSMTISWTDASTWRSNRIEESLGPLASILESSIEDVENSYAEEDDYNDFNVDGTGIAELSSKTPEGYTPGLGGRLLVGFSNTRRFPWGASMKVHEGSVRYIIELPTALEHSAIEIP